MSNVILDPNTTKIPAKVEAYIEEDGSVVITYSNLVYEGNDPDDNTDYGQITLTIRPYEDEENFTLSLESNNSVSFLHRTSDEVDIIFEGIVEPSELELA